MPCQLRTVVDELKSIQPPIGLIICDEGHRLKSAGAKTTKALQAFSTKRRVILTGTPIQNELSEFHSMVDFINPGLFDDWNCFKRCVAAPCLPSMTILNIAFRLNSTYEQPILKSREPKATADVKELGQARGEALGAITRKFVLRRTSEVIAGYLPPKCAFQPFAAGPYAPSEYRTVLTYHVCSRVCRLCRAYENADGHLQASARVRGNQGCPARRQLWPSAHHPAQEALQLPRPPGVRRCMSPMHLTLALADSDGHDASRTIRKATMSSSSSL